MLQTLGAHIVPLTSEEHKHLWPSASEQTGGAWLAGSGVVSLGVEPAPPRVYKPATLLCLVALRP